MSFPSPVASAANVFVPYREKLVRDPVKPTRVRECAVCLGQHEDEIHAATVRVHRWFRVEVTRGLVRQPAC